MSRGGALKPPSLKLKHDTGRRIKILWRLCAKWYLYAESPVDILSVAVFPYDDTSQFVECTNGRNGLWLGVEDWKSGLVVGFILKMGVVCLKWVKAGKCLFVWWDLLRVLNSLDWSNVTDSLGWDRLGSYLIRFGITRITWISKSQQHDTKTNTPHMRPFHVMQTLCVIALQEIVLGILCTIECHRDDRTTFPPYVPACRWNECVTPRGKSNSLEKHDIIQAQKSTCVPLRHFPHSTMYQEPISPRNWHSIAEACY